MLVHQRCRWLLPCALGMLAAGSISAVRPENVRRRVVADENKMGSGGNDKVNRKDDANYWERYLQVLDSLPAATVPSPAPVEVPVAPVPQPTSVPIPAPTQAPVPQPTSMPLSMPTEAPVAPQAPPSVAPVPVTTQAPLPLPSTMPVAAPIDATAAPAMSPTTAPLPAQTPAPVPQTSAMPVAAPVETSLPPVMSPVTEPLPAPTTAPVPQSTTMPVTLAPVVSPSAMPVPILTPAPVPQPSVMPVSAPVDMPAAPVIIPSTAPLSAPTAMPSSMGVATGMPSLISNATDAPVEQVACQLDVEITCVYGQGSTSCDNLALEEQFTCSCGECARELIFNYTANRCDRLQGCKDEGAGPLATSLVLITSSGDVSDILFSGNVSIGDAIVLSRDDSSCLAESLTFEVINPSDGNTAQVFEIDTSCVESRDLELLRSYGAFDFKGYSCDANDVHNCMVDVLFELDACNLGLSSLALESLSFDINGVGASAVDIEILPGEPPGILGTNECYQSSARSALELCTNSEYLVVGSAEARTIDETELCGDVDELSIVIGPSSGPEPGETQPPSPAATMMPIPGATQMPIPPMTPPPGPGPQPGETQPPVPEATMMPVPAATMMPVPAATMMPVPAATMMPVPAATMMPVPATTMMPVPAATIMPIAPVTPPPGPGPQPGETQPPVPEATMMPINPDTPPPGPGPVPDTTQPVAAPSEAPVSAPVVVTVPPAAQGTGCLDVVLGCVFGPSRTSCESLAAEDQFTCTCGNCPTELVFNYTEGGCNGLEGCEDIGAGPASASQILVTTSGAPSDVLFSGSISRGDIIVVSREDGSCLPESLNMQVSDPGGNALQTFDVDTSCAVGSSLELLQSYGAFTFRGYSCDDGEVHNCMVDAFFELDACNIGLENLALESLRFDISGVGATSVDAEILPGPLPGILPPNECHRTTASAGLEVCIDSQYTAVGSVDARPMTSGGQCQDEAELTIGWEV